ncbi:MAG TPA: hypothetical protein VFK87_09240, partial [Steroidobacteraceae bacterium]|nr:hypothetical protein [Steroidobacteraceae bacterium]
VGSGPLYLSDARIVAIASDTPQPHATIPVVDLDDVSAIADLVQTRAEPLGAVMRALAGSGPRR